MISTWHLNDSIVLVVDLEVARLGGEQCVGVGVVAEAILRLGSTKSGQTQKESKLKLHCSLSEKCPFSAKESPKSVIRKLSIPDPPHMFEERERVKKTNCS